MRIRQRALSLLLALTLAAMPVMAAAYEAAPEENGTYTEVPTLEAAPEEALEGAPAARTVVASGGCGEYEGRTETIPAVYIWNTSLAWTLDSDGTLTVSGSGEMGDFVFEEYGGTIILPWNDVRDSIKRVVVEEGAASVSDHAFFHCEALTEVDIAGSVRSIGRNAFSVSPKLERAVIRPGSGCTLGDYAFQNCSSLTDLSLGEGVSSLGLYAFSGCAGLTDVSLPESIRSLGYGSFYNCSGLTEIVLPEHTEKVGHEAFEGCDSLKKVTSPEGLTLPPLPGGVETETYTGPTPGGTGGGSTGDGETGDGSTGDGETGGGSTGDGETGNGSTGDGETGGGEDPDPIVPGPSATVVKSGNCGKNGDNVQYRLYSDGTLDISGSGEMADYGQNAPSPWGASAVKRASIGKGVASVGAYAFYEHTALESVSLPEGLTSIGNLAFPGCAALKDLRLPESLTYIGTYAFSECNSLTSVTIPQAVTSLQYAFFNCASLTEARVHCQLSLPSYTFPGACKVTRYGTARGECGKTAGSLTWTLEESGLLTIRGTGAMKDFYGNDGLPGWSAEGMYPIKSVVLETGVSCVGKQAFSNCAALERVQLPEGLTAMGNYAFYGCSALTEITLPRSLESIGTNTFRDSGLTRARVYYLTEYSLGAFPAGCAVELYGRDLTPDAPLTASRTAPAGSDNIHSQNYGNWSKPVRSYLAPRDGGGFYRVDYYSRYNSAKKDWDIDLVMEAYNRRGNFLRGWNIPRELPVFGGFFAGSDGFYFIFGQHNPNEQNGAEVIRVVKYTKNLERLGEASLTAGPSREIWSVFSGASLRAAEGNGTLFIHTGTEGYAGSDGLHHESDLLFAVDTAAMTPLPVPFALSSFASHSFNQFVQVDGDTAAAVNHGDTFPRGVQLVLFPASLNGKSTPVMQMSFGGNMANNYTGAAVGGFEFSPSHYLTAVSSINQNSFSSSKTHNVSLLVTDKNAGTTRRVQVTSYAEGGSVSASTPQLVKFSDSLFAVLWEERTLSGSYYSSQTTGTVKYAFFNGAGNQLGGVRSMSGTLSDCRPEIIDGKAVWYVTEDGGAPVFYQIDSAGGSSSFRPGISTGVVLPDSLLARLGSCETVFAASYNDKDRMTGVLRGVLEDGSAEFGQRLPRGWLLYFLDGNGAPVCPPYPVP